MAADKLTKPLGLEPRRKMPRLHTLLLAAPIAAIGIGGAILWAVRSGDSRVPQPAAIDAKHGFAPVPLSSPVPNGRS